MHSMTPSSPSASTGSTARRTSCSSELRRECPVHWTARITRVPRGGRLLVGHDGRRRPRGQPRLADLLVRARRRHRAHATRLPARAVARDVHRDGPAQARPHQGAVPGAASRRSGSPTHEDEIRAIVVDVLDRLEGRETCDLVTDVAQPVVSRVIGSFMGIPPEDDAIWANLMNSTLGAGDPDLNPEGVEGVIEQRHPRDLRALPADDRRAAREPDRRPDQRARARRGRRPEARGARDRDGLLPARRGRQRQHEGDLLQRRCGR